MDDYRLTLSDPGGMLVSTQLISTLMARVSSRFSTPLESLQRTRGAHYVSTWMQ